jgi:heme-degrading monooxygenase HmoA
MRNPSIFVNMLSLPPFPRDAAVIARTWQGRVPAHLSEAYLDYLRRTGLADYQSTPGFLGLQVLHRTEGDVGHFLLITTWESLDAIRAFAGTDPDRARYYPDDDAFLLERSATVTHYEVVESRERGKVSSKQ